MRAATGAAHDRVESALGLLDPALSRERVAGSLALLYGFWSPVEAAADAWAARSPELAERLEWPRRRRAALLHDDLVALGVRPDRLPRHAGVTVDSDAALLAWLYVAEGSTLGGAVISRSLTATGTAVPRYFTPYPDGPGPMWRGYLDVLEEWAGPDELRRAAVVAAAVCVFDALADWVCTASSEGVA